MAGSQLLPPLMGSPRLPDADDRLRALQLCRLAVPFSWGAHDCALWAADAVHAQLGVDPAASLRGRYASARGALRVLAGLGGTVGVAHAVLGAPLRGPLMARLGDIGLTSQAALAVCMGSWWAVAGERGLAQLRLSQVALAWGVGACRK